MQNSDTRLISFSAITKPKSKAKPAFPLSASTHPNLTPNNLSAAGFHHTPGPSSSGSDNCKCFLCNVELGGWDEEDDPFEEHARRGNCAWAEMVCSVKLEKRKRDRSDGQYTTTYKTPESLPQSSESASVREQTFKKWWPHKAKSGWLPTVKNLARAGFVYTPSTESKDSVMCPYCEYGVEGWEATDDPWQIHSSKVPDCHFFRAEVEGAGPSEAKSTSQASSRSKKAETSKRSKRGTTAANGALSDDGAGAAPSQSEGEMSVAPSQPAGTKKKATKPRVTTTKAKTAGRGKKKAATTEPETEVDHIDLDVDLDVDETAAEIIAAGPLEDSEAGGDEEQVEKVKEVKVRKARATKTKSRAPTASTSASSRSKSKKKLEDTQSEIEARTEEEPIPTEAESEKEPDVEENEPEVRATDSKSMPTSESSRSAQISSSASASSNKNLSKSTKSVKSTNTKPLPPLPSSSLPTSPSPQKQKQPLSQLDRFANIPPSSPVFAPTPRAKSTLRSTQPVTKPSSLSDLPREVLESSLTRGAVEARRVIEDLMSSPLPTPTPKNSARHNVSETDDEGDETEIADRNADSNGHEAGAGREDRMKVKEEGVGMVKLTKEQKSITLEDLIRSEMKKRYEELREDGRAMIDKFEQRTKMERVKIESI